MTNPLSPPSVAVQCIFHYLRIVFKLLQFVDLLFTAGIMPNRRLKFNRMAINYYIFQFGISEGTDHCGIPYVTTIRRVTTVFLMTCDFKEKIWDFLLQALSVFDEEVRIVNAPGVDPHEPECGFSIMAGDYELEIEHMRFYAIREKFEDNQMFGRYYRELPPERQKEWIERIEKAARRKVVIFDPENPEAKLPRMPFLVPSHLSESEKERRREERRKLLRAAGIDPAEEGL